ncbi:MAG: hypothetical protein MJ071_08370 [Oscillospiraceae bacterium]|nr:hypothetical protein [Oscillospiraceae bacterium]
MNLIRYWSRKGYWAIYLCVSVVITLMIGLSSAEKKETFLRMLPVCYGLLLMLRTLDDIYDYEKDRSCKVQDLTKRQLQIMLCVLSVLWTLLHVWIWGMSGLISVGIIAYVLFMEKCRFLQPLLLPAAYAIYLHLNGISVSITVWIVSAVLLLLSVLFFIWKVRKK